MDDTYTTGVALTEIERRIVKGCAEKLGLGERGFSAALRIIIREWAEIKAQPERQPQKEQ